jgi:hypothetical protein
MVGWLTQMQIPSHAFAVGACLDHVTTPNTDTVSFAQ